MVVPSPAELQRRKDEDTMQAMLCDIERMLAKRPAQDHEKLLREAGIWELWNRLSHEPVWRRCHHGGPAPTPALNVQLAECSRQIELFKRQYLGRSASSCSVCNFWQRVDKLAGSICLPPIVLASMAVDAWINNDQPSVNLFMILACALDAGGVQVFDALKQGRQASKSLPMGDESTKLRDRLNKLMSVSNAATLEVMEEFVTCDCIARAWRLGKGLPPTDPPIDRESSRASDSDSGSSDESDLPQASPFPFNIGMSAGSQFFQDMEALDLKERALEFQAQGNYTQALELMKRSVKLRENSHTICLSLSELADLYLNMLRLEDAERTCHRMMEEASSPYRYDDARQQEIAKEILDDIMIERRYGLWHGMRVEIVHLKQRAELNGRVGIVRGRIEDSIGCQRIMVEVRGSMMKIQRRNVKSMEPAKQTPKDFASLLPLPRPHSGGTSLGTSTSRISIISAASPVKCFVEGTSFRCPDETFVLVEDIEQHEILVGASGEAVEVVSIKCHDPENVSLMRLRAGDAHLLITSDHRIVVPRGTQEQTIPASHLRVGDVVMCSDDVKTLDEAEEMLVHTSVYEIVFKPDVAIETYFLMSDAILTKGAKVKKTSTRRGGMKYQRKDDVASVPITHDAAMCDDPSCEFCKR